MHIRRATSVALCCALVGLSLVAEGAGSLEELWRRGLFDEVRVQVEAGIARGDDSRAFLGDAARASYEAGAYEVAADLYKRLADHLALDPDEYRSAKALQWKSLWRENNEHSSGGWVRGARTEVERLLDETKETKSPRRQLALELQWLLESTIDSSFKPQS